MQIRVLATEGALFGALQRVRLWLSYQRYAFLCFVLAAGLVAGVAAVAPHAWWAWLLVALPTYKLASFGVYVFARFPRKMRATALADRRIAAGRFHPRSIRAYCDDPCFRVVAAEILARAGTGRAERRRLIRDFREQRAAPQILYVADPAVRGFDNPRQRSETP